MSSTTSSELIFVTGASGFLGSHVVLQLLENGYRVRAAARGAKADLLKASYAGYGDRFEVVKIADIVHDQFPDAFVGVSAVMHLASPLPGRVPPAEILKAAVDGTLNVIVQGEKAGVRRMVVTSSIASVKNPQESFTDKGGFPPPRMLLSTYQPAPDWNPITREFALTGGSDWATYAASKKFAELALWEWADQHPHVDVTTLNPTYFYGPFTPLFPVPDASVLSTDLHVYNLLFPDGVFPAETRYVDVRDAAQAHVRALSAPPTAAVGRKRIARLITAAPKALPADVLPMDFGRVEEVLGMKIADFHTTEQTTLDTVDALIAVEEQWRKDGQPIKTPPPY
ncbi:hypothetical protein GGX14DRAFT_548978 [Mycena pura]|uniref:NAD-dependent epimerase/dehydratase domain-containing protein n=1 Tax=Mycena pura TaxID=153505 RepID=A0AAD6YPC1_9AGAR|nr:hypothetical protein GGX14DRAFT_548978 [Mycena pura]